MTRRNLLILIVTLTTAGFAAGWGANDTWTSIQRALAVPVPPPRCPAPPAVEPVPWADLGAESLCGELAGQVKDLEAQIAFRDQLYRSLEEEVYGVPTPWPADTAPIFQEAGYRAALERAIAECGIPWEIEGLECSEPPCIAKIRPAPGEDTMYLHTGPIHQCAAWLEHYDDGVAMASNRVECEDGGFEPILLLSPRPKESDEQERERRGASLHVIDDEEQNQSKRLQYRWDEIQRGWACAGE